MMKQRRPVKILITKEDAEQLQEDASQATDELEITFKADADIIQEEIEKSFPELRNRL